MMLLAALMLTACSSANGQTEVEEVDLSVVSRQVEAFGRVVVGEEMNVSLNIPVRVEALAVSNGDSLKKDEVVISLDLTTMDHQAADLKAELAVIQAEINALAAELGQETTRLNQDLAYAEKAYALALEDFNIRKSLQAAGAISIEEMDRYQREAEARQKEMEDLQLTLRQRSGAEKLQVRRQQYEVLEGKALRLKAQLEQPFIRENKLVCPYERGAVTDLTVKQGDSIEAGQRILGFMNLDSLMVEADVLEEFIGDVVVGAPVTLVPVADRTKTYEGTVSSIAQVAYVVNNETVVPITISLNHADDFLRPNFNVDVFIDLP